MIIKTFTNYSLTSFKPPQIKEQFTTKIMAQIPPDIDKIDVRLFKSSLKKTCQHYSKERISGYKIEFYSTTNNN